MGRLLLCDSLERIMIRIMNWTLVLDGALVVFVNYVQYSILWFALQSGHGASLPQPAFAVVVYSQIMKLKYHKLRRLNS